MEALPPGIFSPLAPGHSVATLVLIENSEEMMSRWPDLRDRYLPNLLGTMRRANPHVPIQILWMTSCPAPSEDQLSPSFNRSRQYNQLPELRPIAHPKNRISLGTLYRALELLSSTFQDVPTTRHLIVVSASTPIDDLDDMVGIPSTPDSQSAWDYLSSVVCQKSIYLHMILTPAPGHDMDKFVRLHADTSRIQGCCNANPWFQADLDKYSFFLSCPVNPVPAMQQGMGAIPESADSYPVSPSYLPNNSPPQNASLSHPLRASLPRNNSFPPAGVGQRIPIRPAIHLRHEPEMQRPSLVKHLQKVHGLTKKRTYGLQPARAPFVRDDSGDTSYDHALDSISSTPDAQAIYSSASSAPPISPRTAIPRRQRRSSASQIVKQKALEEPRRPARRSPRIASSDSDSPKSASSPTAISPLATLAPVCEATGPVPPCAPADHAMRDPDVVYPSAPLAEPAPAIGQLWAQDASSMLAHSQAQMAESAPEPLPMPAPAMMPPQAPPPGADFQSAPPPAAYMTPYPAPPGPPPPELPAPAPAPLDDGDKPFIFYPEYEQAMAVPLAQEQYAPPPRPPPPHHASQPARFEGGQAWPQGGTDYSHLLNPAVSPGMLRSSSHAGAPVPMYEAALAYPAEHAPAVQHWAGY